MATVTMPGIELVSVGTWNASKGDGKVTPEDIAAMAAAARNPMADRVPIKIGHSDSRFQDADGNPPSDLDGSPAYGWVENLRPSADGKTLLGDFVGVPEKLAAAMPSAFRNRSVEYVPGKRVGGLAYRAVLTGLALLGAETPAVKGLSDVLALYREGPTVQGGLISLSQSGETDEARRARVRRAFYPGSLDDYAPVQHFAADDNSMQARVRRAYFPKPL